MSDQNKNKNQVGTSVSEEKYASGSSLFGMNKTITRVLFGILALAFIVGMIFIGAQGASVNKSNKGKADITVNGKPLYELELAQQAQTDPILSTGPTGLLKTLAELVFGEKQIIRQALLQDASRVRVPARDVKKQIDEIKTSRGIKTKKEWDELLTQYNYTDSRLRGEISESLRLSKRSDQIVESVKVSAEEEKLYYDLYKDQYKTDEQIVARQIVVDDKKLAQDLYGQAKGGADFADLARKNSKLNADQGGALGADKGKSDPKPVTRVVFPATVAKAAFALVKGGITRPEESGGRFYIVKVDSFVPSGDPKFEDIKDKVAEDAKRIKGQGALETYLEDLRKKTNVTFADGSAYSKPNPVVSVVDGSEVKLVDVASAMLANEQLPQLLQNGMGEMAVQFFLPQTNESLISRDAVVEAAKKLGQPFFGGRTNIAMQAQLWKTRDIKISDADVTAYYKKNISNYTQFATAMVKAINFSSADKAKAEAFRKAALKGGDLAKLATANGGNVQDYGLSTRGQIGAVQNKVVFETKGGFAKSSLGEISDVIKLDDGSFQVLTINDRKEEFVKPFATVAADARVGALTEKRTAAGDKWVESVRKAAKVTDNLTAVLAQITPKEDAAPAAPTTPETK